MKRLLVFIFIVVISVFAFSVANTKAADNGGKGTHTTERRVIRSTYDYPQSVVFTSRDIGITMRSSRKYFHFSIESDRNGLIVTSNITCHNNCSLKRDNDGSYYLQAQDGSKPIRFFVNDEGDIQIGYQSGWLVYAIWTVDD